MLNDGLLAISLFLHLAATVFWLGGLALLTLVVTPDARALMGKGEGSSALLSLLDKSHKKLQNVANLSLIILIVTGLYQMGVNPNYEGLLQFNNDWSRAMLVKHIAVIGMIGVGAIMQFGVLPALERAALLNAKGKPSEMESLRARERRLTRINGILGVIVLACTAIATAIR
ncbi:MAG: hypothetical protein OHK0023_23570 [Anaerolineae bacterium]